MSTLFRCVCFLIPTVFSLQSRPQPIVQTSLGKIIGNSLIKSNEFLGIPFATPPIGNLRFRPSVVINKSWEPSIYEATTWAPACMQVAPFNITYPSGLSEDCLYLNIWQPIDATSANTKPVLFFIHGGFGTWGSPSELTIDGRSEYNGTVLASFDIVVVTIQYRLNVFGSFTSKELTNEDPDWPAYGGMNNLFDQITALKWVQSHILQFGGNSKDVTVFGESFGANSVCSLIVSSFAKGLFKNAFQESGGCEYPGAWGPLPLDLGLLTTNTLMNYTNTSNLQEVRALSAMELEKASNVTAYGGAYIDNYVMPIAPYKFYKNLSYPVNPTGFVILGSDEMDGVTGPPFYTGAQPQNEQQYQEILNEYLTNEQTAAVMKQYPYNDTISPAWAWWEIGSDLCVRCPTLYQADDITARDGGPNVFVYQFEGPNRSEQPPSPHGGELCFLFNNEQLNGPHNSCQSFFVVDFNETYAQWMQETIVSAMHNYPNNPVLQPNNVEWGVYGENGNDYVVIWNDEPFIMNEQPDRSNCDWWAQSGISGPKQVQICWNVKAITT